MGCQCLNRLFLGRGSLFLLALGSFSFLLGGLKFRFGANHLNAWRNKKWLLPSPSQIFREPGFSTSSLLHWGFFAYHKGGVITFPFS